MPLGISGRQVPDRPVADAPRRNRALCSKLAGETAGLLRLGPFGAAAALPDGNTSQDPIHRRRRPFRTSCAPPVRRRLSTPDSPANVKYRVAQETVSLQTERPLS